MARLVAYLPTQRNAKAGNAARLPTPYIRSEIPARLYGEVLPFLTMAAFSPVRILWHCPDVAEPKDVPVMMQREKQ